MRKLIAIILLVSTWVFINPRLALAETYGSDILTGGTESCSGTYGAPYTCDAALDNNTSTRWGTADALPQYLRYDLGAGVSAKPARMTITSYDDVNGQGVKEWELWGSNDNFTTTSSIATGTVPDVADGTQSSSTWAPPTTAYRYLHMNFPTNSYRGDADITFYELELMECTSCSAGSARKLRVFFRR